MSCLEITGLCVRINKRMVLNGVNLSVPSGQVHALMGPNGSGKTTLARTLIGDPRYKITAGSIRYQNQDVLKLSPVARAKLGMFMSWQQPPELPGVSLADFLRLAVNGKGRRPVDVPTFYRHLDKAGRRLKMKPELIARGLNAGSSGGERKKAEIMQMMILRPALCVLDETDSGLDIDALKIVAAGINSMRSCQRGFLVITHYQRLLDYIKPDRVHIMSGGRIVKSGGPRLARKLEKIGYASIQP